MNATISRRLNNFQAFGIEAQIKATEGGKSLSGYNLGVLVPAHASAHAQLNGKHEARALRAYR
jgi:hypothetical protein